MRSLFYLSLLLLLLISQAWAQSTVTIQGIITDSKGAILPDGERRVTINIYDSQNSKQPLWSDQQILVIKEGQFSTTLGNANPLTLDSGKKYWLGIKVDEEKEMTPRMPLNYAAKSGIGILTPGTFDWDLNGSNIYYDDGNVGIGTSTPSQLLEVSKNALGVRILVRNEGGGGGAGFEFIDDLSGADWKIKATQFGGFKIRDHANSLDVMGFDTNGNVGIGTLSPSAKLDVVGNIEVNGDVDINSDLNVDGGTLHVDGTNDRVGIGTTSPNHSFEVAGTSFFTGKMEIGGNTSFTGSLSIIQTGFGDIFEFSDNSNDNLVVSQPTNHNILFGPTTGLTNLHFRTNSTERLTITKDGAIGIGTTSPGAQLEVAGQVKITGGSPGLNKVLTSDVNGLATWQTPNGGSDGDWTVSGNNIFSAVSGNVGIGTNNPTSKLQVEGNVDINSDLDVDGGTLHVDSTNDRVGIGLNIPEEKLDVSGNIRASGTIQSGSSIVIDGSTNQITATGGTIRFDDENLTTTGTTTTNALILSGLDCSANANGGALTANASGVVSCSDDDSSSGSSDFSNGGEAGGADRTLGNADNFDLGFLTNNISRFHIQNDGKVGIGTTDPLDQLHIEGSGTFDASLRLTNTQGPQLSSWGISANNGFNQLIFSDRVNTTGRMFIGGDGNVGIADNRPDANLEVVDDFMVSSSAGADGDLFIVKNSGNVGIGKTSPQATLHVNSSSQTIALFQSSDQIAKLNIQGLNTLSGDVGISAVDSDLRLIAGNTFRMAVTGPGNVGIGTTNPVAKLEIGGVFSDNAGSGYSMVLGGNRWGFRISTNTNDEDFHIDRNLSGTPTPALTIDKVNGNLGIGTTNPTSRLQVDGNVDINSDLDVDGGTLHVDGTNHNVGIGTTNPLHFTGAGGPSTFTGNGVHIKASHQARLILEGDEVSSEWIDSGGDVNAKILSLLVDNGVASFQSKNDNLTTIMDNILSMDLGGNVGVGTATPSKKLHVDGDLRVGGILSLDAPGNSGIPGTPIEVLRIDSGSDTNIGTLAGANLTLSAGNSMRFFTNDPSFQQTKMVISSQGNVGIGNTGNNPSAQLHTTGSVRFANFGAGTLNTTANGELFVNSDVRLKAIKGNFSRGLTAILKIEPINYSWKQESGLDSKNTYTGFSAQNIQDVIPEAVNKDKQGNLTLSDRPIIAALINSIKELKMQNEELKQELKIIKMAIGK